MAGRAKRVERVGRTAAGPRASRGRLDRNAVFQRFYALVDSIPRGRVATYGQIAREAGLPRHARHVGRALRELPDGSKLPWHRVVNGRGEISVRASEGFGRQRELLEAEGIQLGPTGRIDLKRFRWEPDF